MFRRALLASVLWFFVSSTTWGQSIKLESQLPIWAQEKWQSIAKKQSLEISTRINPFVWRGDFDGDRRADFAIFVSHTASKKEGIVMLFQSARKSLVLGAGVSFGNGGDDFSWIDSWSIEDRGSVQRSFYEKPLLLKSDALLVVKAESASALIYVAEGKPKWQQQGD